MGYDVEERRVATAMEAIDATAAEPDARPAAFARLAGVLSAGFADIFTRGHDREHVSGHACGIDRADDQDQCPDVRFKRNICADRRPVTVAGGVLPPREAVDMSAPPNVDAVPALETDPLELMRRVARTVPHLAVMCASEVEEDLGHGRLAFAPIQGSPVRRSVALVHRAAGPLDPVVGAAAAALEDALDGGAPPWPVRCRSAEETAR